MTETEPQKTTSEPPRPKRRWRSILWAEATVDFARAHGFDATKPGFAWFDLARRIHADLDSLGDLGRTSWSPLLLRCTALDFLARAHLARTAGRTGEGPLGNEDWDRIRQLPGMAQTWAGLTVANAEALSAWLGPDRNPTLLHALAEQDRKALSLAVRTFTTVLAHPLEKEARLLPRALRTRWLRVGAAALLLALPVLLAAVGIQRVFRSPNIALHRPVAVSSQYPFEGTNHALLVDGDRSNLGFSTNIGGQQWVAIDLGAIRHFDKVVVTNRVDCCQSRAVPLKLEVSDDNLVYRPLAERKETFATWTASGLNASGRYIRLKNAPNNFLHLAEVEVY